MTETQTAPETTSTPEVPLVETPEFKAALQEAVAQIVPDLLAQLSAARGAPASGDAAFADQIAMAIAQLTDQGTGRKRVAPEIIAQRARARERMTKLIVEARANGLVPTYQLRNKVYLDEVLVDPVYVDPATKSVTPVQIDWPGVPSEAMAPVNDVARSIHGAFMESIGSVETGIPEDRLGVTAGGLVVKNGAVQPRRELGSLDGQPPSGGEGLRLRHKELAPAQHKTINVLGTVAAPARVGVL